MWAFATAGVAAEALYAAVAQAAVRSGLAGFSPQNLAITVWAYATAGVAADALYAAEAEAAVPSSRQSEWDLPYAAPGKGRARSSTEPRAPSDPGGE